MRKNQYQCMSEFQDSLRKLYNTINYSPKEIFIKPPNGIVQTFVFANKGMLVKYFEELTKQVREAIKISDGIRLDRWSEKEYQDELEKKVGSYEESIKSYEDEKRVYEDKIRAYEDEKRAYEEEIDKQSERIAGLEEELRAHESSPAEDTGKEMRDLISNIIALRDGQMIKRDYLYDQGEDESSVSLRIVEATLKETANLLKKSGVEILEDQGAFSSQRQTIVDVKETEEESLNGQIAEVVRPGYFYQGEPLRGQEVITYKMKE